MKFNIDNIEIVNDYGNSIYYSYNNIININVSDNNNDNINDTVRKKFYVGKI